MGKEGLEKLAAAVAHPDEAKTDLVACAEHPGRGQRRSGTHSRGRHRGLREITTVENPWTRLMPFSGRLRAGHA